jgi:type I restriction enzyme M protein
MMRKQGFQSLANFIWAVADLLRGPYRPPQYKRVMLSLTVLRSFDCALEDTKEDVLAAYEKIKVKNQMLELFKKKGEEVSAKPLSKD